MTNVIEVVFENVDEGCVKQLLASFMANAAKIRDAQCSEDIEVFSEGRLSNDGLEQFMDLNSDASVAINMQEVMMGSIALSELHLRLIKYGGQYDIDFSFGCNSFESASKDLLVKELHSHAMQLCEKYKVASVFCGMEPASDLDTRYFTNGVLGPIAT